MPRMARTYINSNYLHIMSQGIRKEYIFCKERYKQEYLNLLKKYYSMSDKIDLLFYCIMDNHVHLLVYIEDIKDLSNIMNKINTSYGIYYNKQEDRVGYVFRNRYYIQEIIDQRQLFTTIAYIHKNPLEAEIVEKLEDYKYSSYNLYRNEQVSERIFKLAFNCDKYKEAKETFYEIHKIEYSEFSEGKMLEREKLEFVVENIREEIDEFCTRTQISFEDLKKENYFLIQLTNFLKNKYYIKDKEICNLLGIGKNRLTYIRKKYFKAEK